MSAANIQQLLDEQLSSWKLASDNYLALQQVKVKELNVDGTRYKVQFNPARMVSSAAKVDSQSIRERKCFLCAAHLPAEQKGIPFGGHYTILVNPFPIFPKHLTIPEVQHTDQRIQNRMADMLDLAAFADEYVIFYNGPRCGASAPDHAHFQAGNKGFMPIEQDWKNKATQVFTYHTANLLYLDDPNRPALVIEACDKRDATELFDMVYNAMELKPGEEEPMMNLIAWVDDNGKWIVCIFPRSKHRPSCYTAEGDANILISPASVDMGGVFITPREEDFEKLTARNIAGILQEVCLDPIEFRQLVQRIIDSVKI